jgi:hypothetical protein
MFSSSPTNKQATTKKKDCCFIHEGEGTTPTKRRYPLRHIPENLNT